MVDANILMVVMMLVMFAGIILGFHIALVLSIVSFLGTYLLYGDIGIAVAQLGSSSFEVLRSYTFATIPMFILMGECIARSGAAKDIFVIINKGLKMIPGRLAVATVVGNTVFAAVTGSSIASATTFSRISYPQMQDFRYDKKYALGSIAGSACLGMLIPPSVLLIVWGLLMEMSIGRLFVAGVIPGVLLALLYVIYNIVVAIYNPHVIGGKDRQSTADTARDTEQSTTFAQYFSGVGIVAIIFFVLGGIWGGLFTATEASGVGAILAMIMGVFKGMRWQHCKQAVISASKISAPIMFILLAGAMYARFMASAGIISVIQDILTSVGGGAIGTLVLMAIIWLILGAVLDSISIILLTVPIFAPIAAMLGYDALAFTIFGILLIEAGLLTPPFGLLVYTVKSAIKDDTVTLTDIFSSSVPYWVMMLIVSVLVIMFPSLTNLLT